MVDLHSAVGVTLAAAMALLNFSGREIFRTLRIVCGAAAEPHELIDGLNMLRTLARYQFRTALFLWLMILIMVLLNGHLHTDPLNTVGHLIAVVLMTSLYLIGLMLLVLMPAQTALSRRLLLAGSELE
jgi:hypothetical protein